MNPAIEILSRNVEEHAPAREAIERILGWLGNKFPDNMQSLEKVRFAPNGIADFEEALGTYNPERRSITVSGKAPLDQIPETVSHEFQHHLDNVLGGLDNPEDVLYFDRPAERSAWPFGRQMATFYNAEQAGQPFLFPEADVLDTIHADTMHDMNLRAARRREALKHALGGAISFEPQQRFFSDWWKGAYDPTPGLTEDVMGPHWMKWIAGTRP